MTDSERPWEPEKLQRLRRVKTELMTKLDTKNEERDRIQYEISKVNERITEEEKRLR